jgi:hypothetical protein
MQHEKRSREDKTATKQQRSLVHDSVNHPRLRSSSLPHGTARYSICLVPL